MNQVQQQFLNHAPRQFPPGFQFVPTDEELIVHYLKKKIDNEPHADAFIFNVEFYKYNPWELTEMYPTLARDEWYFFTSREKKYLNGSRPNRAAGDGYWKATVADQRIYDHNKECIGFKKTLVFYKDKEKVPNGKGKKTNWIMHEYTLFHDNMRLDDCVLCRIHERIKTVAEIEASQAAPPNHDPRAQLDHGIQRALEEIERILFDDDDEVFVDMDTGGFVDF